LASGFAQIGPDAARPASCGRGGRIVALSAALASLVPRHEPSRTVPGPDASLWADITEQAERAAGLFRSLLLVGLDVILDLTSSGRIIPVFLEANPRPAGLCHTRLLSGLPANDDLPGVGLEIWDGLEAWCSPRRSTGSASLSQEQRRGSSGSSPG
jgi:hypothetical protein